MNPPYAIDERNLEKLFRVAHPRQLPSPRDLHRAISSISSEIGLLRLTSYTHKLSLAINRTNKTRSISIDCDLPVLDVERLIQAVCQNSEAYSGTPDQLLILMRELRVDFELFPTRLRVRGKDYLEVLHLTLTKTKTGIKECGPTLLATLDEKKTCNCKRLGGVVTYLSKSKS
jgi:hypothetical protein